MSRCAVGELRYLGELMGKAPVLAFAKDTAGRYLYVNATWLAFTGFSREQVLGRTDHELFPAHIADGFVKNDQQVLRTGQTVDAEEMAESDGQLRVGHSTKFALRDAEGRVSGVAGISVDITERYSAQKALEQSERRYRELLEHSPDAYFLLDPRTGKFADVNENACRLLEMTREELLTLGPLDVSPQSQADGRLSELAAVGYIGATLGGETPVFDWVHRTSKGELLPCRIWLSRVEFPDGMFVRASILDMREIERVRSLLGRTRAQLDAVQDALPQLVVVYDPIRRVLIHDNHTHRQLLGAAPARPLWESARDACERAMREGSARAELELVISSGQRRVVEVEVMVYHRDELGQATRLLLVGSDVTEQRELEAQLRQARRLESLGRLAGGIAHDFNNLLTVILGSADFLGPALQGDERALRDLGALEDAARQAQGLTNQLLAFAKADQGSVRAVDVDTLVSGSLRMLERLIGEHVRTELRLGAAHTRVLIDEGQLLQVVMNLSVNARDAMPRGGVLAIASRVVELSGDHGGGGALPPGRYLELCFEDTGEGMSAEVAEKAFEPFFSTKPRGEGTGLGLSTVFGIVQRASGHVAIDSARGRGTSVRIWLPTHQPFESSSPPGPARFPARHTGRILLVEDDPSVRAVSARALGDAGFSVTLAEDPRAALALIERGERFDLVVSDVVMPVMSGLRLAEELRARLGEVRVLFVSGYAEQALREHGVDAREVELLHKPFLPAALVERVSALLG